MSDEDLTWMLSPHGRSPEVCRWVIDNYGDNLYNEMIEKWVKASQQILDALPEEEPPETENDEDE